LSVGAQPSEKVNALIRKVKTNRFGSAKAPPPMLAPKVREEAAPAEPAEAAAAE
jgi:small subunit ribosomal protein S16